MTTILLICSVALNIGLLVWAVVMWNAKEEWQTVAKELSTYWRVLAASATSESASTPGTSTESPTPAPDAD